MTAIAQSKKDKLDQPWQAVEPLVNVPDRVEFTSEELTLLLSLDDKVLFNDLVITDEIHNARIALYEKFSSRRLLLTDNIPAIMVGKIGHIALTEEQELVLGPRMVELNAMIRSMLKYGPLDEAGTHNLLTRLSTLFNDRLGLGFKFEPKSLQGKPAAAPTPAS